MAPTANPTGGPPYAPVTDEVWRLLRAAPGGSAYSAALIAALRLPGNVLSDAPDARWARPVQACCVAAGGSEGQALPVAAAVEVFMVALDILDDAEDGEETALQGEMGGACALNVSTGLLFLAQRGLLAGGSGAALAHLLLDAGLRVCGGQHADLTDARERPIDLGDALAITAGKLGSLMAAVCQLGAACAGADTRTQDLFARFGGYVGIVGQLINDLKALEPGTTGKTDIVMCRPTLPLVHADSLAPRGQTDADIRTAVWARGPAHLTWAVAETYRSRARDLIPHLADNDAAGVGLEALLPSL